MKRLFIGLIAVAVIGSAEATEPDRESVQRLVHAFYPDPHTAALVYLDRDKARYADAVTKMRWKNPTTEEINQMYRSVSEEMDEQITWKTLQEVMIRAYSRRFSQEEIDGALKFFESDAGRAWLEKSGLAQKEIADAVDKCAQDVFKSAITKLLKLPITEESAPE